jgi:DNA-directed RNA polymerase specialized sigma24 family protein
LLVEGEEGVEVKLFMREGGSTRADVQASGSPSRSALSRLYDETGSLVYGLALSWMGDRSTAEQITMEVYEKIYRSGVSVACGNKKPLLWLLCLTYRHMEAHLTKTSRAAVASTSGLLALTSQERMVVELACRTRLPLEEIAAGLDWSVERVRTRLGTGMTRLRTELQQVHHDSPALD